MKQRQFLQYNFQHQHLSLLELLHSLSEGFIQKNWISGKWSIHQQLAHLVRYQEIFEDRLQRIIAESQPSFGRYRAENDPEFSNWTKLPTGMMISKLNEKRAALTLFFEKLSEHDWKKNGSHPKFGLLNIENWLHFFLLHESHHIYSIFRVIKEFHSEKK